MAPPYRASLTSFSIMGLILISSTLHCSAATRLVAGAGSAAAAALPAAPSPFIDPFQRATLRQLAVFWGPFRGSWTWLAGNASVPRRCSTFVGVTRCDERGRVLTLSLPSAGIQGQFINALSRLYALRHLNVNNNSFYGSLTLLADLKKLTYLNLARNKGFNNLAGRLSLLTNLRYLDFGYNGIARPLPAFLSELQQLTYLDLLRNTWQGSLPAGLGQLSNLQFLRISQTNEGLGGSVPLSFSALTKLTRLQLNDNLLEGSLPAFFGNFVDLVYLRLSGNKWVGTIPQSYSKLTKLVFLGIKEATLSGPIPNGLGRLQQLTYLSLFYNTLQGSIPPSIFNLTNLETLALQNNYLSGTLPQNLAHMKNLQELILADNYLTGRVPRTIPYSLKELDIASNYFFGDPTVYLPNGQRACQECNADGQCKRRFSIESNCLTYPLNWKACDDAGDQRTSQECAAFCGTGTVQRQCGGIGVCVPANITDGVPRAFRCKLPSLR